MTLPQAPVPLWKPIAARAEDYFSDEEVARSKSYQRPLQRSRLVGTLVVLAVIVALIWTEAVPELIDAIGVPPWPLALLVAVALVIVATSVASLPLGIWREFGHEKRWGFSTQTPGRFAADQVKEALVLGVVISYLIFLPVWAIMRATGLWWIYGAVVFILFFVVLQWLGPLVIIPLFNKLTPLEDDDLKGRLAALAERAGVHISSYQVMDASKRSTKDNAFFAGMGGTRKVVLFDNLLQLPKENVEVVVGHELGHWRRKHQRRFLAVGFLTSVVLFAGTAAVMRWDAALDWAGVPHAGDPAAFPLFALVFSGLFFVTRYVDLWFSRWSEREADLDALELTGRVEAYGDLWRNMSDRNLPDLDPSWFAKLRRSHPPVAERMAFAEVWSRARSSAGAGGPGPT